MRKKDSLKYKFINLFRVDEISIRKWIVKND